MDAEGLAKFLGTLQVLFHDWQCRLDPLSDLGALSRVTLVFVAALLLETLSEPQTVEVLTQWPR